MATSLPTSLPTCDETELTGSEIAIIGMAGRFPQARNLDAFWALLRDGREAITPLTEAELETSLLDPADPADPSYVKAAAVLEDADLFDAAFFGFTPREAELMDPQHRLFLECAWEALEHGGYEPESYPHPVGVFAGARTNTYLFNLFSNRAQVGALGSFEVGLGNDLAFLPTRVSYKFNLRGPSYAVHTACSTALVAVHLACQSLLVDECRMALAGGVALNVPQKTGYLYTRGGIVSPDGHCRAFAADAQGTLFGSGLGVVLLKRLEDALADGDTIHAVIKGTATNNDGAAKASFTAPSAQGQATVIAEALANAGVAPETISYVETHGTGTALGDPIEVRGLTRALRSQGGAAAQRCALGAVKSNLGHLDAAAGMAGLLKTVLALQHKQLPPSLFCEQPNPNIDFAGAGFYVNHQLRAWENGHGPRRAGLSAFGVGGTNAHVILEEAPPAVPTAAGARQQLLVLSARTPTALDAASAQLAAFLRENPTAPLADVSFTLQQGRKAFSYRRALVASEALAAATALEQNDPQQVWSEFQEATERPLALLFPGGGAQHFGMGHELYAHAPEYRRAVDECCELLLPQLGPQLANDLRSILQPAPEPSPEAREAVTRRLRQTSVGLPALFVVEYALAQQLLAWGLKPEALIGHSLGEYVAACLAGVFSLADALSVVVLRGRLFERLAPGGMLSVALSEAEALACAQRLAEENADAALSIAAINGPEQCVLSGPVAAIEAAAARLREQNVECQPLHIEVAAHSPMVDAIVEEFVAHVAQLALQAPQLPFVSNVSGTWITAAEAQDPAYWGRHLRGTVRFADGVETLLSDRSRVLVEVGPGHSLSALTKLQRGYERGRAVLNAMRHPYETQPDDAVLLGLLGRLWLAGVNVNWAQVRGTEKRRRLPLPTYPFERQRYWVGPGTAPAVAATPALRGKEPDVTNWFHVPTWQRSAPLPLPAALSATGTEQTTWLVFTKEDSLSAALVERLRASGRRVVTVQPGATFALVAPDAFRLPPAQPEAYRELVNALSAAQTSPINVIHLWSLSAGVAEAAEAEAFRHAQSGGFYSLLYLAQAWAAAGHSDAARWWIVTNGLHAVESADVLQPEQAPLLGPAKVIPQELPQIALTTVDIQPPAPGSRAEARLLEQLLSEFAATSPAPNVALRGAQRWLQGFTALPLATTQPLRRPWRAGGVYWLTGGLGGVGLLLARSLAEQLQARLVLIGRTPLPARESWDDWLRTHAADDATSRRLQAIREMEAAGAEVLVVAADVADAAQMRAVLAETQARFGALHGVIHAAGVTSGPSVFTPLTEINAAAAEAQFQPKAYGLYVLAEVLRAVPLDFCLLTSSNSAVLGGMGFVAYAAANAFMDAFATQQAALGQPWVSASWDPWPEETKQYHGVQTSMDRYTMTPAESAEAFRRAATLAPAGQLVVATGDLPARLALWIEGRGAATATETPTVAHPRPRIASTFVAPRDAGEQAIAAIWQELLGVEQVGVNDNFFDLGGHSLLATRLVGRLRTSFNLELPLQQFFQTPTVAGLAQAVAAAQAARAERHDAELLELVARLSEEEVARELSRRNGAA